MAVKAGRDWARPPMRSHTSLWAIARTSLPHRMLGLVSFLVICLGVVILLNNMTQPLAGLLVGLFAGGGQTGLLIVMHSPGTGAIGAVVTVLGSLLGRTAVQAIPARDHREFDLQSREGT